MVDADKLLGTVALELPRAQAETQTGVFLPCAWIPWQNDQRKREGTSEVRARLSLLGMRTGGHRRAQFLKASVLAVRGGSRWRRLAPGFQASRTTLTPGAPPYNRQRSAARPCVLRRRQVNAIGQRHVVSPQSFRAALKHASTVRVIKSAHCLCGQPQRVNEGMGPQRSLWPPAKGGLVSPVSLHPSPSGRANRRVPDQGAGGRMRTDQSLRLRHWHQPRGRGGPVELQLLAQRRMTAHWNDMKCTKCLEAFMGWSG